MSEQRPDYVSISRFARAYGVDRGTVYKWLRQGLLEHYRVGVVVRIKNLPPSQHTKTPPPADIC